MKRFLFGVVAGALLWSGTGTSAQLSEVPTGVPSIKAANGRAVRVDLDGDGRKEQVSLQEPRQKRYNRDYRPFRIRVNGQFFNGVWTDSDMPGMGDEMKLSLEFYLLKRTSRRRYLFLGGPFGLEWRAHKVYEWRGGKLRPVLRDAMMIDHINDDGTLRENQSYNWGYAFFPWRRNRNGVFELVPRPFYPVYSSWNKDRRVTTRLAKAARFHRTARASSATFLIPKNAEITLDGIDLHHWLRARYGKKIGWLPFKTVDESYETFPLPRAG